MPVWMCSKRFLKLIFTKLYDELESKRDKINIEFYLDQNLNDEERGDYEKPQEMSCGTQRQKISCNEIQKHRPNRHGT